MRRMYLAVSLFTVALSASAQREGGFGDRLAREPEDVPRQMRILAVDGTRQPDTTNSYAKMAATYADGSTSPSAIFGLNHDAAVHPWWVEAGYRYRSGDDTKRNSVSASGNYQFWTGKGSRSPYLQVGADYVNRFDVAQRVDAYIDGGVSFGAFSADLLVGVSTADPENDSATTDFVPALSLMYALSARTSLAADYVGKNDVDGEDSFDIGVRQRLGRGFTLDVVLYKHADIRVRLKKSFAPFRSR